MVRFDVAPWGEIGNIKVLEAQPAKAFGDSALGLLRSAKAAPVPRGYVGCLVPVRFKLEGGVATPVTTSGQAVEATTY